MSLLASFLAEATPLRARRAALALLAFLPVASCALFQGSVMLPNMTKEEAAAYGQYLGGQLAAIAKSSVESQQLSLDALRSTASSFEQLGHGELPTLRDTMFNAGSIGAAVLQLTLNDIHYQLMLKGGIQGGSLVENAKIACLEIASKLQQTHQELTDAQGS